MDGFDISEFTPYDEHLNQELKTVDYFGTEVRVPVSAICIATDENGTIFSYDCNVKTVEGVKDREEAGYWISEDPTFSYNDAHWYYVGTAIYEGDWHSSCKVL